MQLCRIDGHADRLAATAVPGAGFDDRQFRRRRRRNEGGRTGGSDDVVDGNVERPCPVAVMPTCSGRMPTVTLRPGWS